MQHNPVLGANLACISRYNPKLSEKIIKITELKNEIYFAQTVLNEPNLVYNGFVLHDLNGAENEAVEIFNKTENHPLMLHVIYGFGLGYLFQQFANNSKGIVLLYEPNIEILAATLEVVDFTNELSRRNVYVFNDFETLLEVYKKSYTQDSKTVISLLPSYNRIFTEELKAFVHNLQWEMGAIIIDNNYIRGRLLTSIKNVFENMEYVIKEPPITVLKNLYKNKTALVVSAGPTLDKNLDTIKQNREKFVLIAVGNATRTLCLNGITPDFVTIVDMCNSTSQIEGLDLSNSNLILEPLTNLDMHKAAFKNIFSYPSVTSFANTLWADWAGIDVSDLVSIGTVSYMALYCAVIFGCKDIILVGQDFAYVDGKCYSSGSKQNIITYSVDQKTGKVEIIADVNKLKDALTSDSAGCSDDEKLEIAKIRLNMIKNNLVTVDGIGGNKLPTTVDYASFLIQFEKFANKFKDRLNLYNTSLVGAKINGFKDIPLRDILKEKTIMEKPILNTAYAYDLTKIINNFEKELKYLLDAEKLLGLKDGIIKTFKDAYQLKLSVNDTCLMQFKQLMTLYIDFKENYCAKSKLLNCIQMPSYLLLEPELRKAEASDMKDILNLFNALVLYLDTVFIDVKEFKNILEIKRELLNEMLNSKG